MKKLEIYLLELYLRRILNIYSIIAGANNCKIIENNISYVIQPLLGQLLVPIIPVDIIWNINYQKNANEFLKRSCQNNVWYLF